MRSGTTRSWLVGLGLCGVVACADQPTAPRQTYSRASASDAVKFWESGASVYWNGVARELVVKYLFNPFQAIRTYAILSTSQYNAVIAAEKGRDGKLHPSPMAAVAGASVTALTYIFPAEAAGLEALVDDQLASTPWPGEGHTDWAAGEAAGRAVAETVVARARTDGFFAPFTGTIPVGAGVWFSSASPPAPPIGVLFGKARTYFLESGDQFRPSPPPAFGSPDFFAALREVRQVSDTRTPEQDALAKFWAFPVGTYSPSGYWNDQASQLAVRYHLREREAAHVLALVNMTGFDAIVACHDAKYAYWLLRPTQADPGITLSIGLPNFPSYPSNHACLSSAQAAVLGAMFPAEKSRLRALAEEAALSRLYGGIHYRFDNETGLRLGRMVAALALRSDVSGHEPFELQ